MEKLIEELHAGGEQGTLTFELIVPGAFHTKLKLPGIDLVDLPDCAERQFRDPIS